jgi:peptidoglycan/LPS O-acetylase OafA/YrhL
MAGVVAFQLGRIVVPRLHYALWVPFLCLTIAIWYLVWQADPKVFGHASRALISYALCSVVGLSFNFFKDMPNGIFASVCFVIAKYSYGIYLLHVPAMYLAFVVLSHLPAAIQWLALCILMAVLPWLACRFVEEPMISVGRLLGARVTRESVLHAQLADTQQ